MKSANKQEVIDFFSDDYVIHLDEVLLPNHGPKMRTYNLSMSKLTDSNIF